MPTDSALAVHHNLTTSFTHKAMLSIKVLSLTLACLSSCVTGWHFQTNGIQYLTPDIHDSVIRFAQETVDLTWDKTGIHVDEVLFGTLEDDWVIELLASNNGTFGPAPALGEESYSVVRRQDEDVEAACGTPNCDDQDIYQIASLQTQQSVIRWGCRGVEWIAIPTLTTAVAIKVTGYFCNSGDGAFLCQLGWGVVVSQPTIQLWRGGDSICEYLMQETLDACEQVGGGKTCTVRDGTQVGQISVRTTVGPPEDTVCGSSEECFEFEWEA